MTSTSTKTPSPDEQAGTFTWRSERLGESVTLIAARDMEFGIFEDAMDKGEAGVAALVRAACHTEDDHTTLRRFRIWEINDLFAAWNGGATPGESVGSST